MEKPSIPIRVTISEAARLFGIDPHTVRRALKNQELRYIVVQGRYKINFESLLEWSQKRITVHNKMNSRGIGQFVEHWKIRNKKFSPSSDVLQNKKEEKK